jgi:hypothetical protein
MYHRGEMMLERLANKLLNYAQRKIAEAYNEDGLTDDILDLQLKVNKLRAEYDLPETDEFQQ